MSREFLVLATVCCLATGCGPAGSEGDDGNFVQRDSAGVTIGVNPRTLARTPLGWRVDSTPDLVIGNEGDGSDYLYRVQGVKGFPDGRILVVDGQSCELRFFDSEGRLLERVGRRGKGPGEFLDPVLVPWAGQDSLLLFDKGNPRFQVFTKDGQAARTLRLVAGWPAGRVPPLGAVGQHMLISRTRIVGGETALQEDGMWRLRKEFFWFDLAEPREILLDTLTYDWAYRTNDRETPIPFAAKGAAVVTPRGALVTDGRSAEIRSYGLNGRLRRIIRIPGSRRPVTKAMVDIVADSMAETLTWFSRGQWESEYDRVPLADSLPVFKSLLVDDLGWLWAERYGWDPRRPKEWWVFDSTGRAHGTVRTPASLEIQSIGWDFVVGIWRDDWEVEYVRRHPLRRGSREGAGGTETPE